MRTYTLRAVIAHDSTGQLRIELEEMIERALNVERRQHAKADEQRVREVRRLRDQLAHAERHVADLHAALAAARTALIVADVRQGGSWRERVGVGVEGASHD